MSCKAQAWVETVVYTLIGLTIIGIVIGMATPKIKSMTDEAINATKSNRLFFKRLKPLILTKPSSCNAFFRFLFLERRNAIGSEIRAKSKKILKIKLSIIH